MYFRFDERYIKEDIKSRMLEGINGTKAIIVFVTTRYMLKVNGDDRTDNCQLEFKHSFNSKKPMICVTMDPSMSDPANWTGMLEFLVGGSLFVSMHEDFDEDYFSKVMGNLLEQLNRMGITPTNKPGIQNIPETGK